MRLSRVLEFLGSWLHSLPHTAVWCASGRGITILFLHLVTTLWSAPMTVAVRKTERRVWWLSLVVQIWIWTMPSHSCWASSSHIILIGAIEEVMSSWVSSTTWAVRSVLPRWWLLAIVKFARGHHGLITDALALLFRLFNPSVAIRWKFTYFHRLGEANRFIEVVWRRLNTSVLVVMKILCILAKIVAGPAGHVCSRITLQNWSSVTLTRFWPLWLTDTSIAEGRWAPLVRSRGHVLASGRCRLADWVVCCAHLAHWIRRYKFRGIPAHNWRLGSLALHFSKCCKRGLHAQGKLWHIYLSIAIHVKSTQDCNKFLFGREMAHGAQVALKVARVNVAVWPVVNGAESFLYTVVVGILESSLHQVSLQMQSYFLEDELAQGTFNAHRQKFITRQLVVRSLGHSGSQISIIARQEQLQEIMVVEELIAIKVKVFDHLFEVIGFQLTIAIFSLELSYWDSVNVACIISIDTPESCIWFKVTHGSQNLPQAFNWNFLFSVINEHLLDLKLRFVSEHIFTVSIWIFNLSVMVKIII